MVLASPAASDRHRRLAWLLANGLGPGGRAGLEPDTDFDARLQDVPLNNRRPDVTGYRAELDLGQL